MLVNCGLFDGANVKIVWYDKSVKWKTAGGGGDAYRYGWKSSDAMFSDDQKEKLGSTALVQTSRAVQPTANSSLAITAYPEP